MIAHWIGDGRWEVIALWEMPGDAVAEMMAMTGGAQVFRLYKLFKLALVDDSRMVEIEGLSYLKVSQVLTEWMQVSGDPEDKSAGHELELMVTGQGPGPS